MHNIKISTKDQIVMSLIHYFVTKQSYTPIIVKGTKDEIWLENLEAPIKIIRINTNYIHNDEQYNMDIHKLKYVLKQIKKKTFTFKMQALNICLDVAERVSLDPIKSVETVRVLKIDDIENNKILKNLFPDIDVEILKKSDNLELIKNVTEDINETTDKKNKLYKEIFESKKIIVTYALIAICTIIFILSMFNNDIFQNGAVNGWYVKNGDYYRLITAVFLHGSFFHLFVNMYSLNLLGKQLENYVGKTKFLIIFLVSGLFGSLFSVLINGDASFSVGASGAIFGLAAALVYFGYYYRVYLNSVFISQLVPVILVNLMIGFMFTGIDNAAHIGGLVGGYLAASAVGIKDKTDFSEQKNGILALIVLLVFLIYLLFI